MSGQGSQGKKLWDHSSSSYAQRILKRLACQGAKAAAIGSMISWAIAKFGVPGQPARDDLRAELSFEDVDPGYLLEVPLPEHPCIPAQPGFFDGMQSLNMLVWAALYQVGSFLMSTGEHIGAVIQELRGLRRARNLYRSGEYGNDEYFKEVMSRLTRLVKLGVLAGDFLPAEWSVTYARLKTEPMVQASEESVGSPQRPTEECEQEEEEPELAAADQPERLVVRAMCQKGVSRKLMQELLAERDSLSNYTKEILSSRSSYRKYSLRQMRALYLTVEKQIFLNDKGNASSALPLLDQLVQLRQMLYRLEVLEECDPESLPVKELGVQCQLLFVIALIMEHDLDGARQHMESVDEVLSSYLSSLPAQEVDVVKRKFSVVCEQAVLVVRCCRPLEVLETASSRVKLLCSKWQEIGVQAVESVPVAAAAPSAVLRLDLLAQALERMKLTSRSLEDEARLMTELKHYLANASEGEQQCRQRAQHLDAIVVAIAPKEMSEAQLQDPTERRHHVNLAELYLFLGRMMATYANSGSSSDQDRLAVVDALEEALVICARLELFLVKAILEEMGVVALKQQAMELRETMRVSCDSTLWLRHRWGKSKYAQQGLALSAEELADTVALCLAKPKFYEEAQAALRRLNRYADAHSIGEVARDAKVVNQYQRATPEQRRAYRAALFVYFKTNQFVEHVQSIKPQAVPPTSGDDISRPSSDWGVGVQDLESAPVVPSPTAEKMRLGEKINLTQVVRQMLVPGKSELGTSAQTLTTAAASETPVEKASVVADVKPMGDLQPELETFSSVETTSAVAIAPSAVSEASGLAVGPMVEPMTQSVYDRLAEQVEGWKDPKIEEIDTVLAGPLASFLKVLDFAAQIPDKLTIDATILGLKVILYKANILQKRKGTQEQAKALYMDLEERGSPLCQKNVQETVGRPKQAGIVALLDQAKRAQAVLNEKQQSAAGSASTSAPAAKVVVGPFHATATLPANLEEIAQEMVKLIMESRRPIDSQALEKVGKMANSPCSDNIRNTLKNQEFLWLCGVMKVGAPVAVQFNPQVPSLQVHLTEICKLCVMKGPSVVMADMKRQILPQQKQGGPFQQPPPGCAQS